jgi:hydroxypyruvate isomerase
MPRFCANLTLLYNEADFLDRFALAAKDGFEGIEYLFPYDFPKERLVEKLRENGLAQVLHNLPAGNWGEGERGIACLPGREGEFQDGVGKAIAYAKALDCRQLNCLVGIAPESTPRRLLERTLIDNLRFAAGALAKDGIRLLVEPISTRDIPGFFVSTTRQAEALLDAVGSDNLFIQYDVYHMQIMEGDLLRSIKRLLPAIEHIQIADNPGRHEPGTGEIAFERLLPAIDALGYQGFVGCEYLPAAGTVQGLGWASPWLKNRV